MDEQNDIVVLWHEFETEIHCLVTETRSLFREQSEMLQCLQVVKLFSNQRVFGFRNKRVPACFRKPVWRYCSRFSDRIAQ